MESGWSINRCPLARSLAYRRILISRICLREESTVCGRVHLHRCRGARATKQFTISLDVAPMTDRYTREPPRSRSGWRRRKIASVLAVDRARSKMRLWSKSHYRGSSPPFESSSMRAGMRYITTRGHVVGKILEAHFNHPRTSLVSSCKFASSASRRAKVAAASDQGAIFSREVYRPVVETF